MGDGVNGSMESDITPNGNGSGGGEGSVEDTGVELYTVIWGLLALLTLGVVGTAANAALLAATRCKRSVRNLYYGLFYNACVLNLLLCVLWMPLHFAQLVESFSGRGLGAGLCYVNACLLHALVAALVCCLVFLTVQRLYHMWRLSAKGTNLVAAGGIVASWLVAGVAAVAVALEFGRTVPYEVCVGGSLSYARLQQQDVQDPTVMAVLATLYFVILILTLITLLILLLLKRQTLSRLLKLKYTPHDLDAPLGQGQEVSTGSEQMSPKHRCLDSAEQTNNSTADSLLSGQLIQVKEQETSMNEEVTATEEEEEEEEDDDTFDMKMRQRQRNSGRRHTVANIGLGDPSFGGRRGSLGNISDRSPTSNAHNYQYVRKWSVDIVALQDQLENPKGLAPMLPFRELQQKLKDLDQPASGQTEDPPPASPSPASPTTQEPPTKPPKKKKTVQLDNRIEEIDDLHGSMEPLSEPELPSIVVNGNNANTASDTECVHTPLGGGGCVDNEHLAQIDKELTKSSKVIAVLLVLILCIVPYVVVQILRSSTPPRLAYNLSQVSAAACLLQAPLLPLLFAWVDPRLLQALHRLKAHLTNWRCVCYCNIGKSKGKACFGRPSMHYEGTSTA